MNSKQRIILLQQQISIATKALTDIKNQDSYSAAGTAEEALEKMEHAKFVKGAE